MAVLFLVLGIVSVLLLLGGVVVARSLPDSDTRAIERETAKRERVMKDLRDSPWRVLP